MPHPPSRHPAAQPAKSPSSHTAVTAATVLAAGGVLAAGVFGWMQWHTTQQGGGSAATAQRSGPMLLAPMIGVIEPCIAARADADTDSNGLRNSCTGPDGSAAALVESTLSALQARDTATASPYPLGYTLPVPLLQLFRSTPQGWRLDDEMVGRLVRTVRDADRSLILYLFSTHFATDAPLEKALAQDPANLAQTRDGPLAQGKYYDSAINNWSFARTDTELTARRVQATQALLGEICRLPAQHIAKIQGVTLLGELHHLFPDFEAGMGFNAPYRVTDYSPASVAGFQQYLRGQFPSIAQLNRVLKADYASFDAVQPPSRDIRTEPLQRYTEHMDSFAQGSLPISGWAHVPPRAEATTQHMSWVPQVHIYRNGVFIGKTAVNQGRQDVLAAKPEFGDANTGWRLDMDFRTLPAGQHRLDMYVEHQPGRLQPLGTRTIAVMDRTQSTPQPQPLRAPLPAGAPPNAQVQSHIDQPVDQTAYYFNPLAPLWHAYRQQQVVSYLKFFNGVVNQSCLAGTPHYTHQIIPFTNPSWDANKYAIDASLKPMGDGIRLGVSLYGDATYGNTFGRWLAQTAHPGYGVTEFHPLKALDATAMQQMLSQHAARGAQFVSFFMEPRWQGQRVPRPHNIFSFDPENAQFGSDQLYRALQPQATAASVR
jgi:hypothetical protein